MGDSKADSNFIEIASSILCSSPSANDVVIASESIINNEPIGLLSHQSNVISEPTEQNSTQSRDKNETPLSENKVPTAESQVPTASEPTSPPITGPPSEQQQQTKADPSDICSLCNCILSCPRVLSCCHVFDLHCLVARLTSSASSSQASAGAALVNAPSDSQLQCPIATCRTATPLVPPGLPGLASLPADNALLVQIIAKAVRPETRDVYRLKCSVCVANEPACSLCVDCPALLCPKALESHKLLFSFLTHRVMPFEQLLSGATVGSRESASGSNSCETQSHNATAVASESNTKEKTSTALAMGHLTMPTSCKTHHSPVDRFCFHCQVFLLLLL